MNLHIDRLLYQHLHVVFICVFMYRDIHMHAHLHLHAYQKLTRDPNIVAPLPTKYAYVSLS